MDLVNRLATKERRKVREAVKKALELYRVSKETGAHNNFCKEVEVALERLPDIERFVIQKRYTDRGSPYLTDFVVYNQMLEPAVSHSTFSKIRDRAMIKLALRLQIDVGFDLSSKLEI